ncbi:hypothetical protein ROSI111154_10100 [Rouxiella silvae]
MAIVMGAFSVTAIGGVPFGLKLALWYSWSTPLLCREFVWRDNTHCRMGVITQYDPPSRR